MSKPTPGPEYLTDWVRRYLGEDAIDDDAVDITIEGIVKMIWKLNVEGWDAVATLEKIRKARDNWRRDINSDAHTIANISKILDEPTTGGKEST